MERAASVISSLLGGGGGSGAQAATVKSVLVYPIKSCRGISVPQAPITATGFRWDRQWMLVNSKGRACTQRVEPKLALVEVQMPPEAFAEDWHPTPDDHMGIVRWIADRFSESVIRAPGMEPLKVPLSVECATISDVSVWEWTGAAYDEGAEAAEWFSTFLGCPTRLVRFNEETRLTDPDYARGYKTMFSDGFPYLIVSQGSLDALNEILKEPIPINRFRPNILVEGCHPYAEDMWKSVKINKLTFQGVKLCGRCKVPTINQDTGIPSPTEPTETLQTYRSGEVLLRSHKNKRQVYFGQNAVCKESLSANGEGRIVKVGDPV
uniref:MOSC domain-containing protein n=1 Tax=Zea mays TaxID=4577 RepID=A0A804MQP9_MAIZE